MTYPVVPDVPTGGVTVTNTFVDQAGASVSIPTKLVRITAVGPITANTGIDVYTPTTGKKFRILSYQLSSSTAGAIIFEDGNGNSTGEVLRTPALGANGNVSVASLGEGITSAVANNHLYLDSTTATTATINGWLGIDEV